MASVDTKDLRKKYDLLEGQRSVVEQQWERVEAYVTPYRGRFFSDEKRESSIEWSREQVYDSTAIVAHQNLAANLHGSVSNPTLRWFEVAFRDNELTKNKEAANWLYDVSDTIYHALNDSNFNLEVNEVYQDIVGFGTSALSLEEGKDEPLMFSCIPLNDFVFEEDWRGQVMRFYRRLQWEPAKIVSKFGDSVPENIRKMDEDGNNEKQDVLFCIYPTGNKPADLGKKQSPSRRAFEYCYFLKKCCTVLEKGSYYEMPVFIPRWRKTNMSVWGNSPAMLALGDIQSLNRARKIQLEGSEKKIDPPIFAEERAIMSDLDLSAASLNVVRNIQGIMPYNTGFDVFVSDHMIQQLQEAVEGYFFDSQLKLPAMQGTPATAYEMSIRYQEVQKLLGPTLGRLQHDLLDPVIARTFRILARNGDLPEPPQSVADLNTDYEITYLGSLSTAQRAERAANVERFTVSVANMAPVMPEVLDVVDPEEVVRQLGRDLSIPPSIMRDSSEVKAMQADRQDKQDRAEEAAVASAEGQAMQDMGAGQTTLGVGNV